MAKISEFNTSMSNLENDWKIEIVKKLPWSATFLFASFCFFKWTDNDIVGWICCIVAIIALFLVIKFEYYEKIIDRQEKQIKKYSESAFRIHQNASDTISKMNTSIAEGKYSKTVDSTPTT
jgi:hypothetical protein